MPIDAVGVAETVDAALTDTDEPSSTGGSDRGTASSGANAGGSAGAMRLSRTDSGLTRAVRSRGKREDKIVPPPWPSGRCTLMIVASPTEGAE
jgi:hypothetical protein